MKKSILLSISRAAASLILLSHFPLGLGAQSMEPFSPYSAISPSVEAWQMTKAGNLRPSLYTGAMAFTLPLYTYSDPEFSIPVSLRYSFDGYRPSMDSGTIGYGWYLDFGGVITREIKGLPDEDKSLNSHDRALYGYLYSTQHTNDYGETYSAVSNQFADHNRWATFASSLGAWAITEESAVMDNPFSSVPTQVWISSRDVATDPNWFPDFSQLGQVHYDMTPDIFHFSFLGHSGDFMLQPDGSVRVFNSDLPHGELKVEFETGNTSAHDALDVPRSGFTITDGNGYRYRFGNTLPTMEFSATKNTTALTNANPAYTATAWHLRAIEAPNGRTVTFDYSSRKVITRSSAPYHTPEITGYGPSTGKRSPSRSGFLHSFTLASLVEGMSVDGRPVITFSYRDRLLDETMSQHYGSMYPFMISRPNDINTCDAARRLSGMVVVNGRGSVIMDVELMHDFAPNGTPKMFLHQVRSSVSGAYQFDYHLDGMALPLNDTGSTDYWNYWNGRPYQDIRTAASFSASRYDQISDGSKDPDQACAKAGALTCITYPTGGSTRVEYEPNSAARGLDEDGLVHELSPGTISAGGLRVASLTDEDPVVGASYTTRYSYSDGFLFHIPRYVMRFNTTLEYWRVSEIPDGYGGMTLGRNMDRLHYMATGYGTDCDYQVSRDCTVGYGRVDVIHPDGSVTENHFSNYDEQYGDQYPEGMSYYRFKKRGVYSHYDGYSIENEDYDLPYISVPSTDRRNMRGRPTRILERDADGNPMRETVLSYTADTLSVGRIYYNNLDSYISTPWTCLSPMLERERVYEFLEDGTAVSREETTTYNTLGQVSRRVSTGSGMPRDTTFLTYAYEHETHGADAFPAAVSMVSRLRSRDGSRETVDSESYEYDYPMRHSSPVLARRYRYRDGAVAATEQRATEYDPATFRPSRVSLPGGAFVYYAWDGNNLSSMTSNDPGRVTSYDWKDMVGLTGMHNPDGTSERYRYDSANRLWKMFDSADRLKERHDIRLQWELPASNQTTDNDNQTPSL